ncbi:hypothetical protein AJ78_07458, partial [Emergomyces pasteurianus Ep9510]
ANMTVESEITSLLTVLLQVSPNMLKAHRTKVIPVLETIAERTAPSALQYTVYKKRSSISSVSDDLIQQTSADVVTIKEVGLISSSVSVSDESLPQISDDLNAIDKENLTSFLSVNNESSQETFNILKDVNSIQSQQLLDKIQENLKKIVKFFINNSFNIIRSVLAPLAVKNNHLCDIKSITEKRKSTLNDRYIQCLAQ